MENKFLNYIQDNNDNLKKSDLNEHEKNNSEKLIFLLKSSIEINQENCEHDLEELCLYVEGKSLKNELIKSQILECDSCFDTYSLLKSQIEEIKNITPPYFKEKVYESSIENKSLEINSINNKKDKEKSIVKKSFWYILKNNKLLKYSSGAIAACLLLFFTLNPFNADMSDFHEPKYKESQKESSNDLDIEQSNPAKINTNFDVIEQPRVKSSNSISNEKKNNKLIKENSIILNNQYPKSNKNKELENRDVLKVQELEKKDKSESDNFFSQKTPPKIEFSKPEIFNRSNKINNSNSNIKEEVKLNPSSPSLKKQITIKSPINIQVPSKNVLSNINTSDKSKNQENSNIEEKTKEQKTSESKISILPAEPILPKNDTSNNESEKSDDKPKEENVTGATIINPAKPSVSEMKDESDKKISRAIPKNEKSIKKIISLNFSTNHSGFIIIKDKLDNIVYQSNLIVKGKYNNFSIELNNVSEYSKCFYIDSNSNNIFDESDSLDKQIKINEN